MNIKYLISYSGLVPFIYLIIDLYFLGYLNTEFVNDIAIICHALSILLLVHIIGILIKIIYSLSFMASCQVYSHDNSFLNLFESIKYRF